MKEVTKEEYVSAEISTYESQLRYCNELKESVSVAKKDLEASYVGLLGACEEFSKIKAENIKEIRDYRMTVVRECAEADRAIKSIRILLKDTNIAELREFVSLCERMKALKDSGFSFPSP